MSAREFSEWMAYAKLEPFGEQRGDLRAGIISSVIAAANTPKGKKRPKPQDFMPNFDDEPGEEAPNLNEKLMAVFGQFPVIDKRQDDPSTFDEAVEDIVGGNRW